jgi:hypothetical protein
LLVPDGVYAVTLASDLDLAAPLEFGPRSSLLVTGSGSITAPIVARARDSSRPLFTGAGAMQVMPRIVDGCRISSSWWPVEFNVLADGVEAPVHNLNMPFGTAVLRVTSIFQATGPAPTYEVTGPAISDVAELQVVRGLGSAAVTKLSGAGSIVGGTTYTWEPGGSAPFTDLSFLVAVFGIDGPPNTQIVWTATGLSEFGIRGQFTVECLAFAGDPVE